jgi:hypothetical protein
MNIRIALLAMALGGAAQAAPIQRDLGQGLVFWRVHELPGDLPGPQAVGQEPCILDVRYVRGGEKAGAALLAWLKTHATPHTPVFLLANSDTSGAVLAPLNSPDAVLGLVILGRKTTDFEPDVGVKVTASEDRKAYRALEDGTPIESLVVEKVDKARNDEATLEKARDEDTGQTDTADAGTDEAAKPAKAPPPQVLDPVLQRAVQLDRSLVALKRL